MFHNIRIIFRQIRRNSFFSALKIGGLTIGFAVFLILLQIVRKELSYDDFWPNKKQIVRVALEKYYQGELQIRSARNYRGISGLLMQEFPEVEGRIRIYRDMITLFAGEEQIQDVDMYYCDSNLFTVFPLPIIHTEGPYPFADIHATVISKSLALSLFGRTDVVGREIELNEGWKFYVSAVFEDIPENSHMQVEMFVEWRSLYYYLRNFDNISKELTENPEYSYIEPGPNDTRAWSNRLVYNYILVREDTDIEKLQSRADNLLETFSLPESFEDTRIHPVLQRVPDIHLNSSYPDEIKANSSMYRIYMLMLIGSIVLIVSWVNFINLFAIDFHENASDTAVHVINGASRQQIRRRIYQKALAMSILSGILAWLSIYLIIMWSGLDIAPDPAGFLILCGLVLITSLLTVFIPMVSFRSGNIMDQLKGKVFGKMKGRNYRRVLVLLQFASSIVLISCTLIIYLQMEYTRKKNLGFNPQNVINSLSPMSMNGHPDIPKKLVHLKSTLKGFPGVVRTCVSSSIPGKPFGYPGFTVYRIIGEDELEGYVYRVNIDADFLDTYQIKLLAGQNFRNDQNYLIEEVIINRRAAELLGFGQPAEALGNFIRAGRNQYSIIGVTEDYHHLSLKSEIMPVLFFKSLNWRLGVGYYSFRLRAENPETIRQIARTWSETWPGENFIHNSLDSTYREQYAADMEFGRSFTIAAILAILVSCMGLLGLTKYSALKRTREIGIRKTYGASTVGIFYLLQSETLILILVSSLLGIPLALAIIKRWLSNFVFSISPSWWIFLAALIITLCVALISVSFLSLRTSRANPVDSLRYE